MLLLVLHLLLLLLLVPGCISCGCWHQPAAESQYKYSQ
jgi:hypothetical protein